MKSLIFLAIFLAAPIAAAEPVVLAVNGKDIYVELGAKDGVGAGSELELLHEVVARDPRNGSTLRDRFALGTITVTKSGNAISIAQADAALAPRVLAGDHVRLVSAKRTFVDPWEEQVAASKGASLPPPVAVAGGVQVDHVALARDTWQETLGQPYDKRIARWRALLAQDPQTPYRRAIELEIQSLGQQSAMRDEMLARARSTSTQDRAPRIARLEAELSGTTSSIDPTLSRNSELLVASIERAVPGHPIELALLAHYPDGIQTAWLYARPDGGAGFTRTPLMRDGDAYLRGTIDGALVRGDHVDWYVEVVTAQNEARAALGSQEEPQTIAVDKIVQEDPIEPNRTHIDGHIDYVDFDGRFGKGFDQYYQAELDFTYRFLEPVYAVRLGFGTLSGTGGPKDIIDADRDAGRDMCLDSDGNYRCERMTFSYVYSEVEFRLRPNIALMVRPQAGVLTTDTMAGGGSDRCEGSDLEGCRFRSGFGARGRLRLGTEDGTNLVLGAAVTSHVGTLLEAAYHWLPNRVVPVQITVQVTDQPVVEDFGVRLIADVGIRKTAWFYPSARVSYQARDIDHSGFGGGIALNFDW